MFLYVMHRIHALLTAVGLLLPPAVTVPQC